MGGKSLPFYMLGLSNASGMFDITGTMLMVYWAFAYGFKSLLIVLGFLFRWAQGEPFAFFGLFDIPTLVSIDHEQRRFFGGLHNTVAWSIIVLACIHAVAALVHHYVLRDGVLRRMTSSR